MINPIRYLRVYVYPRGQVPFSATTRRYGADAVLGVSAVLLVVLAFAYVLTVLSGL